MINKVNLTSVEKLFLVKTLVLQLEDLQELRQEMLRVERLHTASEVLTQINQAKATLNKLIGE